MPQSPCRQLTKNPTKQTVKNWQALTLQFAELLFGFWQNGPLPICSSTSSSQIRKPKGSQTTERRDIDLTAWGRSCQSMAMVAHCTHRTRELSVLTTSLFQLHFALLAVARTCSTDLNKRAHTSCYKAPEPTASRERTAAGHCDLLHAEGDSVRDVKAN